MARKRKEISDPQAIARPKKKPKSAQPIPVELQHQTDIGAIEGMTDTRKQIAAQVLAYSGYRKGENVRSGALSCAARRAGVDRNTVYSWLQKDPHFVQAIEEVNEEIISECLNSLRAQASKGNVVACIMLLKIQSAPRFDEQYIRDEAKRKHEIDLWERDRQARTTEDVKPLPIIMYRETKPGDRIASPKADDLDADPDDDE